MNDRMLSDVQREVTNGKMIARKLMCYLCHIFSIMRLTETTKVSTMAVDKNNRLYVNPEFCGSLSKHQCAYVLLHEVLHIVLDHPKRFIKMMGPDCTEQEHYICNIAADLCVQQLLHKDAGEYEIEGGILIDGCIPGTKIPFLSIKGLRRGMTYEQYATLLLDYQDEIPQPPKGGSGSALDPAEAGSNSDGTPKPWEKQTPNSIVEIAQLESQLRAVEQAMDEAESKCKGSVPGELRQSLSVKLRKQPDPFEILRRLTAASVASPVGRDYETMTKRHRRQRYDAPRKRGIIRYAPSCTIVVDTSGSMMGAEQKALTTINQGLKRVHRPTVMCFDCALQDKQRMTHINQFEWQGYGGTDMVSAIELADKEKTDAIVVVTDGETDWPSKKTRAKLIVALVRGDAVENYPPPKWAQVVHCYKEVNVYAY